MDRESQSILRPTPVDSQIEFRPGDFGTLAEALDYAARGDAGFNFYGRKGELTDVLPYAELRARALTQARRLLQLRSRKKTAWEIAAETWASASTISRHLAVLKEADLVLNQRRGQRVIYRLHGEGLAAAAERFFSGFSSLERRFR